MTHPDTLTIPRAVVEQAIALCESLQRYDGTLTGAQVVATVDALRAALQPPAPSDTAITYMTGYSDGREWAGATNQAQPEQPALSGCACRWDADDKRVATCVRHQGWLDVVSEWAERAKAAESQQAQPERAPLSQEQILHLADIHVGSTNSKYPLGESDWINFARAIEAAINAKEQLNG